MGGRGLIKNTEAVAAYQEEAARKSDFERTELNKEKTGVKIEGVEAINPVNGKQVPIFISDYVLATYGTGAIMAVPAHDTRDWEFAKKFDLPIIEVVKGPTESHLDQEAFTDVATGTLVNSGFLDGLSVEDAKGQNVRLAGGERQGPQAGQLQAARLGLQPSAVLGRTHPHGPTARSAAGSPCPRVSCPCACPRSRTSSPARTAESPLARHTEWVNTTCPHCGGPAKRETDTMPQWAGSSWYFLRYCDPHNKDAIASKEALEYWSPVDWYNGGMEHTTLHLLYSRFWHKFPL